MSSCHYNVYDRQGNSSAKFDLEKKNLLLYVRIFSYVKRNLDASPPFPPKAIYKFTWTLGDISWLWKVKVFKIWHEKSGSDRNSTFALCQTSRGNTRRQRLSRFIQERTIPGLGFEEAKEDQRATQNVKNFLLENSIGEQKQVNRVKHFFPLPLWFGFFLKYCCC